MSDLPFAMTREAEVTIEKILMDAQKDLGLLTMARVLCYGLRCSWSNPDGGGGCYPFGHVFIGWDSLEEVIDDGDHSECELVGFRVFIHESTLEHIRGKRIVLDKGKGMAGGDMLAVKDMAGNFRGV